MQSGLNGSLPWDSSAVYITNLCLILCTAQSKSSSDGGRDDLWKQAVHPGQETFPDHSNKDSLLQTQEGPYRYVLSLS